MNHRNLGMITKGTLNVHVLLKRFFFNKISLLFISQKVNVSVHSMADGTNVKFYKNELNKFVRRNKSSKIYACGALKAGSSSIIDCLVNTFYALL